MTDLVSELGLTGYTSIPDHSLLQCTIDIMSCSNDPDGIAENAYVSGIKKAPRRFVINNDSNPPFIDDSMRGHIHATLNRIESEIENRRDVDHVRGCVKVLHADVALKIFHFYGAWHSTLNFSLNVLSLVQSFIFLISGRCLVTKKKNSPGGFPCVT